MPPRAGFHLSRLSLARPPVPRDTYSFRHCLFDYQYKLYPFFPRFVKGEERTKITGNLLQNRFVYGKMKQKAEAGASRPFPPPDSL